MDIEKEKKIKEIESLLLPSLTKQEDTKYMVIEKQKRTEDQSDKIHDDYIEELENKIIPSFRKYIDDFELEFERRESTESEERELYEMRRVYANLLYGISELKSMKLLQKEKYKKQFPSG